MKDNSIAYLIASTVGVFGAAVICGVWIGVVAKVAIWITNL